MARSLAKPNYDDDDNTTEMTIIFLAKRMAQEPKKGACAKCLLHAKKNDASLNWVAYSPYCYVPALRADKAPQSGDLIANGAQSRALCGRGRHICMGICPWLIAGRSRQRLVSPQVL